MVLARPTSCCWLETVEGKRIQASPGTADEKIWAQVQLQEALAVQETEFRKRLENINALTAENFPFSMDYQLSIDKSVYIKLSNGSHWYGLDNQYDMGFKCIIVIIDTFTLCVEHFPKQKVTAIAAADDASWRHTCRFTAPFRICDGLRLTIALYQGVGYKSSYNDTPLQRGKRPCRTGKQGW